MFSKEFCKFLYSMFVDLCPGHKMEGYILYGCAHTSWCILKYENWRGHPFGQNRPYILIKKPPLWIYETFLSFRHNLKENSFNFVCISYSFYCQLGMSILAFCKYAKFFIIFFSPPRFRISKEDALVGELPKSLTVTTFLIYFFPPQPLLTHFLFQLKAL